MLDSTAGFRNVALAVFGFALAIRLAALWAGADATLVKDEIAYTARAEALLDGRGDSNPAIGARARRRGDTRRTARWRRVRSPRSSHRLCYWRKHRI